MNIQNTLLAMDLLIIGKDSLELDLDVDVRDARGMPIFQQYSHMACWKWALANDKNPCVDRCYHSFLYMQHRLGFSNRSFYAFMNHSDNTNALPWSRRNGIKSY